MINSSIQELFKDDFFESFGDSMMDPFAESNFLKDSFSDNDGEEVLSEYLQRKPDEDTAALKGSDIGYPFYDQGPSTPTREDEKKENVTKLSFSTIASDEKLTRVHNKRKRDESVTKKSAESICIGPIFKKRRRDNEDIAELTLNGSFREVSSAESATDVDGASKKPVKSGFLRLRKNQTVLSEEALERLKTKHAALHKVDWRKRKMEEEAEERKRNAYYIAHRIVSGSLLL